MKVKIDLQFNVLCCFDCIQGGWALDESMLVPRDDNDHNYDDDYEEDDDHLQK